MNELFKKDFYRMTKKKLSVKNFIKYMLKQYEIRYLYFYRKNSLLGRYMTRRMRLKYGLEIFTKNIGEGLYIGHAYNITVNKNVVIGKNCNIHKGVTIGQENRGKRKGTPIIGNEVWIGINAVIVGNINVGDNVLIAPNSYINCDIPSNSIVMGNPCIIKKCDTATKDYINNLV